LTGWWIRDGYLSGDSITALMIDVRNRTGFGVALGIQNDIWAQCIQRIPPLGQHVWNQRFWLSSLRPLCESAAGKIFLSLQPDERVALIIRRMNAEMAGGSLIDVGQTMEEIAEVRRTGFAYSKDTDFGNGSIATLLSDPTSELPMTISVAGRTDEIQTQAGLIRSELPEAIKEARSRWIENTPERLFLPDYGALPRTARQVGAQRGL
jgi:DNA-binding IclR family transcriptional regulator